MLSGRDNEDERGTYAGQYIIMKKLQKEKMTRQKPNWLENVPFPWP